MLIFTANITQLALQFEPGQVKLLPIRETPNFNLKLLLQNYIACKWRMTGKIFSLSAIKD